MAIVIKNNRMDNQRTKYASETKMLVLKKLQMIFSEYSIEEDVTFNSDKGRYVADFVVFGPKHRVAIVVETKSHIRYLSPRLDQKLSEIVLSQEPEACYIVTDGIDAKCYEKDNIQGNVTEDFEELLKRQKPKYFTNEGKIVIKNIIEALRKIISDICEDDKYKNVEDKDIKKKKKQLITYINSLKKSDIEQIPSDDTHYAFKKDKERELYHLLLGKYYKEQGSIVKFSNARSIYNMLDNNTMNMCSLVCMNDPSELDYADNYGEEIEETQGESDNKIKINNAQNIFIISCCREEVEQDLTMWRLYADDTRGVCIRFAVDENKLNKNGFYIAPVSYAQDVNFHFELEIIKKIREKLRTCWQIELREWEVWKHFFKKKLYSIEKEIRLLYFPAEDVFSASVSNKWFIDDRTSTYTEMKLFDISNQYSHFPLSVSKVILGVKFPNKKVNAVLLNYRFNESNIGQSNNNEEMVTSSNIEDYQ